MSVIFVESWSNKFFVSIKHISSMNECRTNRFTIYYGDNPRFCDDAKNQSGNLFLIRAPIYHHFSPRKKKDWNCLKKTENERKCYAWIFTPKIAKKVLAFVGNFAWIWIFRPKMVKFFSLLFLLFFGAKIQNLFRVIFR